MNSLCVLRRCLLPRFHSISSHPPHPLPSGVALCHRDDGTDFPRDDAVDDDDEDDEEEEEEEDRGN